MFFLQLERRSSRGAHSGTSARSSPMCSRRRCRRRIPKAQGVGLHAIDFMRVLNDIVLDVRMGLEDDAQVPGETRALSFRVPMEAVGCTRERVCVDRVDLNKREEEKE